MLSVLATALFYLHSTHAQVAQRAFSPMETLYALEVAAATRGWNAQTLDEAGDAWANAGDTSQALELWMAASQVEAQPERLRQIVATALAHGEHDTAYDALLVLNKIAPTIGNTAEQLAYFSAAAAREDAPTRLEAARGRASNALLIDRLLGIQDAELSFEQRAFAVGQALFAEEQWTYACIAFLRAAAAEAQAADAFALAGLSADYAGHDGSTYLRRAMALAPDDAQVQVAFGLHLRALGDDRASLEALVEAVTLAPDAPYLYAELSIAYQRVGNYPQARAMLEIAQSLTNDNAFDELLNQLNTTEERLLESLLTPATVEPTSRS